METKTRIIMTEVKDDRLGKYIRFNVKGQGKLLAEVDRRDKKYIIFNGYSEIGSRTQKDAAIQVAKNYILGFIPDAEFKWNPMTTVIKHK